MAAIVAAARRAPWIGIGTSGNWKTSAEALEASQLDFEVRQEDLFWRRVDKTIPMYTVSHDEKVPMYANVRNEDDLFLGCVTPQYQIIQNRDAFSLIDPFLGNGTITHAGMTVDGLCFMVAEVGMESISGEEFMIDLMVTNSFNTRYPCQIIMTPVRIVCQNMYRKLIDDKVFLAKHTTTANDRIKVIAQGGVVDRKIELFRDVLEGSQSKRMTKWSLDTLIAMLFPYPKEKGPREDTFKKKADEARAEFINVYFDAPDNRMHQNTAFGFINAYFDYLSHRDPTRNLGQPWNDRRLQGIVSGADVNTAVINAAIR